MSQTFEIELRRKYKKDLEALTEEMERESPGWIRERKRDYLLGQILRCLAWIGPIDDWYGEATNRQVDYLTKKVILVFAKYEWWKKRLDGLYKEYIFRILRGSATERTNGNRITQAMIERARNYPIADIVQVNKGGFSLCPNHDDHRPSMDCRKNFCHCYVCGWSGDSIALYMKVRGVDFVTAVTFLGGGLE